MSEIELSKGGLKEVEKRVKENPQCVGGWLYLGNYYFKQERDIQSAKNAFQKAIYLKRECSEAYEGLANCLWAEEQKEHAISKVKEALRIYPNDSSLLGKLGAFLEEVGKDQEAEECYRHALNNEKNEKQAQIWGKKLREIEKKTGRKKCPYCSFDIAQGCDLCPRCHRGISVCPHCNHPNKLFRDQCISCRKPVLPYENWMARGDINRSSYKQWDKCINGLRKKWVYPFPIPIKQEILPNIPSPVIAGDTVIIPNPNNQGLIKSLLGLKINSGEYLWEWQIGHDLSYSCTPVPIKEFLYIPSHGYLRKRPIDGQNTQSYMISSAEQVTPFDCCLPLLHHYKGKHYIIVTSTNSLAIYDLRNEQCSILEIPLQRKTDNIAGIVWNGEKVIILSQKGEILSLDENLTVRSLKLLNDGIMCSPPCSLKKDVYFEFMYENDAKRRVCSFSIDSGTIIDTDLEFEEDCSTKHFHWKFPPLIYKNSILLTSDLYSRIYIVKKEGHILLSVTKQIEVSKGVTEISQPFSAVMGNYLISSTRKSFFYINLENLAEKEVMDLGSLVVGQPAISEKGMLCFLCIDGLYCCEIVSR